MWVMQQHLKSRQQKTFLNDNVNYIAFSPEFEVVQIASY